eukprot:Gb_20238 [translate_table: standard]
MAQLKSPMRGVFSCRRVLLPWRRSLSCEAQAQVEVEAGMLVEEESLYRRLSRLGSPQRSAIAVLDKWVDQGNRLKKVELERFIQELRKYRRYKHALEVSEWMDGHRGLRLALGDYAIRLDLIAKVRDIASAEKYFIELPEFAKNQLSYGALLNCYVKEKLTEKAEALMEKMKELDFASNALPYNNMMTLYMKTGQLEKVPLVIQEMKGNDVTPDTFTYNIRINSCAAVSDIEGAEKVLDEMKRDGRVNDDWTVYSNLAAIYIDSGLVDKAESALREIEKKMPRKDRTAYNFLITMYASIRNIVEVYRIWRLLKVAFPKLTNTSYICILTSLVKLGDVPGAEKCFEEWESDGLSYDIRVPNVLIGAYVGKGMLEKAELFLEHALEKGGKPNFRTWEMFVDGYLENKKFDQAVETMKQAISKVKYREWQPTPAKALAILKYFEELGDVDGAEDFFKRLRGVDHVSTDTYNSLLCTYIQAGKSTSRVLKRMKLDKIDPNEETDRLLKQNSEP